MKKNKLNMLSFILIGIIFFIIITIVMIKVIMNDNLSRDNKIIKDDMNVSNEIEILEDDKNTENTVSIFKEDRIIDFIDKEPIVEINEQIRIKPSDLVIKNDSAVLTIMMDLEFQEFDKTFPLKCKIFDSKRNLLYESNDVGDIYEENKNENSYGVITGAMFEIENYERDNSELIFELYDKNNQLLGEINLDTIYNDLKCTYDENFKAISETDLRYFLNTVSTISLDNEEVSPSWIDIALNLDYNIKEFKYNSIEKEEFLEKGLQEEYYRTGYLVESVDKIIEDYYGMPVEDKMSGEYEILEKDGKKYYSLISAGCGYSGVRVIDINNIEYSDGKYNISYTYWHQGEQLEFDFENEYGKQTVYERNIELIKNEEGALTEFKIVSIGDIKIKEY